MSDAQPCLFFRLIHVIFLCGPPAFYLLGVTFEGIQKPDSFSLRLKSLRLRSLKWNLKKNHLHMNCRHEDKREQRLHLDFFFVTSPNYDQWCHNPPSALTLKEDHGCVSILSDDDALPATGWSGISCVTHVATLVASHVVPKSFPGSFCWIALFNN